MCFLGLQRDETANHVARPGPRVTAPHVPSLCLFGCLCLFVLGLVPFWALRESFFLFAFLWCLLEFLRLQDCCGFEYALWYKRARDLFNARNHTHNPPINSATFTHNSAT